MLHASADNVLASPRAGKQVRQLADEVTVAEPRATGAGAWPDLKVLNPGESVDQAEVATLFEHFTRGSRRSEVAGHGLGLPIVSRVAEVHGGKVQATP